MTSIRKREWFAITMLVILISTLVGATVPIHIAGANDLPAPDETGPYNVGWYLASYQHPDFGRYNAIIYYPAKQNGLLRCQDNSGGPYPGITVANGFFGSNWNITWIPRHLASHGYVTLVFTPPNIAGQDQTQWAQGHSEGIEELKRQNEKRFSPIRGLVDTETFGVIGLSMGGAGAVIAAGTDPEIDAVVGLAPAYMRGVPFMDNFGIPVDPEQLAEIVADLEVAATDVTIPTQLQVGTGDGFVMYDWVRDLGKLMPTTTTKEYIVMNGADHVGFLDLWVCPIGQAIENFLGGSISITFEEQHRISSRYFTSWFQYHLKGLEGYGTYIYGSQAQNDLNTGVLTTLLYN